MEKTLESSGKTIDAAITVALEQLGMDRDQVTVEVLEKPKSGFLGLGGSLARVRVTYGVSRSDKAESFLTELLQKMRSSAVPVITEQADGNLSVVLTGSGLGLLIGHRGDTLDAIQHLTNYAVNRGEEEHIRVSIDAENYRAKRIESLQRLAQKMGAKVIKYHKSMTLEPMNAYERHIIHAALQDTPGLTTHSIGVEPNRRVVVSCPRAPGERPPSSDRPFRQGFRPGSGGPRQGGGYRPAGNRPGGRDGSRYGGDRLPGGYPPSGAPRSDAPRREGDQRTRSNAPRPVGPPHATGAPNAPTPGPQNPRPYDRISQNPEEK